MNKNKKNKLKITILGCGNSLGVPTADGVWGKCKKKERNIRSRCSIYINFKKIGILIDTSPDLRFQCLKNKIKNISHVFYTHFHFDQIGGVNDLEIFFLKKKKKINIYGNRHTIFNFKKKYNYLFNSKDKNYDSILRATIIKKSFKINKSLSFLPVNVKHGNIPTYGYIFAQVAYISDCNKIEKKYFNKLKNLKLLIIDCLQYKKHPCHFNLKQVYDLVENLKPKKIILTNLSNQIDYYNLSKKIKYKNMKVGFDGMKLNI
jgi:phosphoribosyl 1,2-cyclic phosphate phosphodiesterase